MAKETFYFSHDYNARTDKNIKKLLSTKKMTGYGIFWALVEDLYNNANALPTDYKLLADDYRVNEKLVKSVVEDYELFTIQGNTFSSESVKRRLEERSSKSKKASESANKRWGKDANALPTQSDGNAIYKGKDNKGKDISIIEKASSELRSSQQMFESVCMKNSITVIRCKEILEIFITDQKGCDGLYRNIGEIKSHFMNWVPKHLASSKIQVKTKFATPVPSKSE